MIDAQIIIGAILAAIAFGFCARLTWQHPPGATRIFPRHDRRSKKPLPLGRGMKRNREG